jgi:uncharacterized protein involved in outer membrane biogenesis
MKKPSKKLWIVLGGVVGLVLVLVIALPLLIDVNRYRGLIENKAQDALGREVRLGEMKLSLLPSVGVRIDDLAIGALPEEGGGDLLTARRVRVGARLLPLLRKQLKVTSIVVDAPQLTLSRDSQGRWNVQRLVATETAAQQESGQPAIAGRPEFEIGSLRITNGRLNLRDEASGGKPLQATLTDVEIRLEDVSPDRPIEFELSTAWEEIPGAEVHVSGRAGPLFPAEGEAMQVAAALNISHINAQKVVEIAQRVYEVPDDLVGGEDVSVAAKLDLSTGTITRAAVSDVEIEGIALSVRRDSWESLAPKSEAATTSAQPTTDASPPFELSVSNLVVRNAKLDVETELAPGRPLAVSVDDLDLTLDRLPTEGAAHVKLSGLVNDSGRLRVEGDIGPLGEKVSGLPLDISLSLDPIPPSLVQLAAGEEFELDTASGKASVSLGLSGNAPDLLRAQGTTRLSGFNARVAGPTGQPVMLPLDVDAEYDLTARRGGAALQIDKLDLDLSGSRLSARGTIEQAESLHRVDLELLPTSIPADRLAGLLGLVIGELPVSFASESPIELQAHVMGLVGPGRIPQVDGAARLQGFSFMHASLEQPVTQVGANVTLRGETVQIAGLSGVVGTSDFAGDVSIVGFEAPRVEFDLRSKHADFGELFSFLKSEEEGQPTPAAGEETDQGQDALSRMTLEGKIDIERGAFDTLKFTALEARMRWADGILTLRPVNMQLYDGEFQGQVITDLSGAEPTFDIRGDAQGVDMDGFLGENLGSSGLLYGKFFGAVETQTVGADYESIIRGLRGQGTVEVQEGRIGGLDILQTLSKVSGMFGENTLRSLSGRIATEGTAFNAMSGGVSFDGGKMLFNGLLLDSPDFKLQGVGAVDLLNASLNGDFQLKLSRQLSASMRAENSRAGELFWNGSSRQVEVPFSLAGPFTSPAPRVDWNSVAQTALKGRAEDEIRNYLVKQLGGKTEDEPAPAPQKAVAPAQAASTAAPTENLAVEISKFDWGGAFLAPDLRVEGLVHGALIDRSEVIVIDSRGSEIRHDRLGDVDRFVAGSSGRTDRVSIRWKYEVDGKKLLLVKFPVTIRVIVYDKKGASSEKVAQVNR